MDYVKMIFQLLCYIKYMIKINFTCFLKLILMWLLDYLILHMGLTLYF